MRKLWLIWFVLLALPVRADLGFPDTVKFPPQIRINPDQSLEKFEVGEAEIASDKSGKTATYRGQRHARWFAYQPAAGEPAPGYYNGTEARIAKAMLAPLTAAGWQLVWQSEDKGAFSMKRAGGEAWLAVRMDAPQAQVYVETIEVGGAVSRLVLVPPAATPEKVGDKDDLPYLAPYPGSVRTAEGRGNDPLDVTPPGTGAEARLVGSATVLRRYQGPSTLSALQFMSEYRRALTAAGWTVVYPDDKQAAGAGQIIARYAKNGRDLWARLFYEFGALLSFQVADTGAEDWAARLARDCRVPLYGVFFDFNKATIKPESEPVLQKAATLLKGNAEKIEVRGHTDAIGNEADNLKLSEARAASVRTWLTGHGIDAARLGSKGFGKSQPVADNGTEQGRAKNRRVELARTACTPQ